MATTVTTVAIPAATSSPAAAQLSEEVEFEPLPPVADGERCSDPVRRTGWELDEDRRHAERHGTAEQRPAVAAE